MDFINKEFERAKFSLSSVEENEMNVDSNQNSPMPNSPSIKQPVMFISSAFASVSEMATKSMLIPFSNNNNNNGLNSNTSSSSNLIGGSTTSNIIECVLFFSELYLYRFLKIRKTFL